MLAGICINPEIFDKKNIDENYSDLRSMLKSLEKFGFLIIDDQVREKEGKKIFFSNITEKIKNKLQELPENNKQIEIRKIYENFLINNKRKLSKIDKNLNSYFIDEQEVDFNKLTDILNSLKIFQVKEEHLSTFLVDLQKGKYCSIISIQKYENSLLEDCFSRFAEMTDDLSDMPLENVALKYLYPILWNSNKICFYESITGKSFWQDKDGKKGRSKNASRLKNFFEFLIDSALKYREKNSPLEFIFITCGRYQAENYYAEDADESAHYIQEFIFRDLKKKYNKQVVFRLEYKEAEARKKMHPRALVTDITAITFDQIPLVLKNKEKFGDHWVSITKMEPFYSAVRTIDDLKNIIKT